MIDDSAGRPFELNDWQLEDDLHEAEELVNRNKEPAGLRQHDSGLSQSVARWEAHGRHVSVREPHIAQPVQPRPARRRSWTIWISLCLGIMVFVCGAVLSCLSFLSSRSELWDIGLPMLLSGQAVLLFGLILQLDGLWQCNREATDTIEELDSRLNDLRQTTSMMTTTHSPSAQSFYAHMAEGASPHLLLADLKGQIDHLTVKMSQDENY